MIFWSIGYYFKGVYNKIDGMFQELASAHAHGTCEIGPPSYEVITQGQGPSELPPPSYAEAVALLHQAGINGKSFSSVVKQKIQFKSLYSRWMIFIFIYRQQTSLWNTTK